MYRTVLLFAFALRIFAESPSERIGSVDFFGLGDLDAGAVREMLPFREGDLVPSDEVTNETTKRIVKMVGRKAEISRGCCLRDGRSTVYIGLAEPGAPPIEYHPKPKGDLKLPDEVLQIFGDFDKHWEESVVKGDATEDDSQGYTLGRYPPLRADQLKLRDWTRAHTAVVFEVLAESRFREQRAYAATALGYAERSRQQIAALVEAAFDSDGEVRNNAVRALDVLCALGSEVTRRIPAEKFIPLLHSLTWTDRNKGSLLLSAMTESRDPALLKLLHDRALAPLREMAQWKDSGHAGPSLEMLGRIAGIEESRLQQMILSNPRGILTAVH